MIFSFRKKTMFDKLAGTICGALLAVLVLASGVIARVNSGYQDGIPKGKADSSYVNTSGDTMTGMLTAEAFATTGTVSAAALNITGLSTFGATVEVASSKSILFNKDGRAIETGTKFNTCEAYKGGVINLETTADTEFETVTNADIAFTAPRAGDYEVEFVFTALVLPTINQNAQMKEFFRLTRGSDTGEAISITGQWGQDADQDFGTGFPISIKRVFKGLAAGDYTCSLQKKLTSAIQISNNQIECSGDNDEALLMYVREY